MEQTRFDRIEIKGIVDAAGRRALVRALKGAMDLDPHGDAEGSYPIVSMYYDTPDHDVYWDRVRGVASRRKLRVRLYGGVGAPVPPICFVEIKQKYYGRVGKRRMVMAPEDALRLCGGGPIPPGLAPADRRVAEEVRALVRGEGLRPTCLVRYVRQAFLGRADEADLRVTLDTRIRCGPPDIDLRAADDAFGLAPIDDDYSLLEIKVDQAVPLWLVDATRAARMASRSISKYALSCEVLHLANASSAYIPPIPARRAAGRPIAAPLAASLERGTA